MGFATDDLRHDRPPTKQRTSSGHLGREEIPLVVVLDAGTAPTVVRRVVLVAVALTVGGKQVQNFTIFTVRPSITDTCPVGGAGASERAL